MTDKDNKGQEFDIDQPGRSLESTHGNASAGGYPIGQSPYRQAPPQTLTPADHFKFRSQPTEWYHKESSFYIDDPAKHFTRDVNDPALANEPVVHEEKIGDTTYQVPVFSGSTTNVNPFNNERMNQILTQGYGTWEEHEVTKDAADMDVRPPVSPIHPFYRTDPDVAKLANFLSSNNIQTRVGLHCNVMTHKFINTYPSGTIRFSFSHFNTKAELDTCFCYIKEFLNDEGLL